MAAKSSTGLRLPEMPALQNQNNGVDPMDDSGMRQEMVRLQGENEEMVSMMQCKSCNRSAATRVIEDCGHLICERCIQKRKRCGKCKREITLTHRIFFAGTNSGGRKFSGA